MHTQTRICVYTYKHTHVYLHTYAHIHIYTHTSLPTHTHACTYPHTHTPQPPPHPPPGPTTGPCSWPVPDATYAKPAARSPAAGSREARGRTGGMRRRGGDATAQSRTDPALTHRRRLRNHRDGATNTAPRAAPLPLPPSGARKCPEPFGERTRGWRGGAGGGFAPRCRQVAAAPGLAPPPRPPPGGSARTLPAPTYLLPRRAGSPLQAGLAPAPGGGSTAALNPRPHGASERPGVRERWPGGLRPLAPRLSHSPWAPPRTGAAGAEGAGGLCPAACPAPCPARPGLLERRRGEGPRAAPPGFCRLLFAGSQGRWLSHPLRPTAAGVGLGCTAWRVRTARPGLASVAKSMPLTVTLGRRPGALELRRLPDATDVPRVQVLLRGLSCFLFHVGGKGNGEGGGNSSVGPGGTSRNHLPAASRQEQGCLAEVCPKQVSAWGTEIHRDLPATSGSPGEWASLGGSLVTCSSPEVS